MSENQFGYMYIGHLPHGFYEKQIRDYFSQFGKVKRMRLARSAKTGNYRGYGFLEFENETVAKIAADTMNNYLMFNKVLKCHVIPKDKLHPRVFRNSRKLFRVPLKSLFRRKYNRVKSAEQVEKMNERSIAKLKKKEKKLQSMGIDFKLSDLLGDEAPAATPAKEEEVKEESAKKEAGKKRKSDETTANKNINKKEEQQQQTTFKAATPKQEQKTTKPEPEPEPPVKEVVKAQKQKTPIKKTKK